MRPGSPDSAGVCVRRAESSCDSAAFDPVVAASIATASSALLPGSRVKSLRINPPVFHLELQPTGQGLIRCCRCRSIGGRRLPRQPFPRS